MSSDRHNPFLSPIGQQLQGHYQRLRAKTIHQLNRQEDRSYLRLSVAELTIDCSRHRLDRAALAALLELSAEQQLEQAIEALFNGEAVNFTESRPALHTALRGGSRVNAPEVADTLEQMYRFSEEVCSGHWRGATGKPITDVVHIGIGGSGLGPAFVAEALQDYVQTSLSVHFAAQVDGYNMASTLQKLNPQTTLFIVASKSFTTQETLLNARLAQRWVEDYHGSQESALAQHFVAVTAHPQKAAEFGICPSRVYRLWDWVGGRYSVYSAVGLPVLLLIGRRHFEAFLEGARIMDRHFQGTALAHNAPVMMALVGVWYINYYGAQSHAVIPYNQPLNELSRYLQQLEMESNGKSANKWGESIAYDTAPIVWGGAGINGQHTYFQMLHQGTRLVPVDLIIAWQTARGKEEQKRMLLSHFLAQAEVLAEGDPQPDAHKNITGNRPSTTILMDRLHPRCLGQLIALYEHKVFVQSIIWNINAFDQWGVEAGKKRAKAWQKRLSQTGGESAQQLMERIRTLSDDV